ncbi:hypothetical protein ABW20_dc0105588 [Dactylellina cionopaga]|nr:hypothetical protein ABW20_dc0105588 [Dactylellina cionopaga]
MIVDEILTIVKTGTVDGTVGEDVANRRRVAPHRTLPGGTGPNPDPSRSPGPGLNQILTSLHHQEGLMIGIEERVTEDLEQDQGRLNGMTDDRSVKRIAVAMTGVDIAARLLHPRQQHLAKNLTDVNPHETTVEMTVDAITTIPITRTTRDGSAEVAAVIGGAHIAEVTMIENEKGKGKGMGGPTRPGDPALDLPLLKNVHGRALGLIQT